ncbi:MAG: hypothetical protein ACRDWT_09140 [Jatrophihabitantaceae bacterium]
MPGRASASGERREQWRGQSYVVRRVSGAAASKPYRCPGCDQLIRPGLPHIVSWPESDHDAADRRHWHPSCWTARDTRAPGVQRGRSAPRY